jgi:hypothetical protein
MAERNRSKAERRQAEPGRQTKAERRQAKGTRKARGAPEAAEAGANGPPDEGLEARLSRIEQAVASQAALSEQLLGKLDEVLHEARKSARHAKTAVTRPDGDGDGDPPAAA